ncbi:hypothetical protein JVT61DRAFT_946 [Boletus reticuloceps]|uniref:Protein kinase domain-containing protein n=1 Tax=Boletus reticuloceps TaxID=495285 RepID=A0A8I2YR22_9AGAM|nr:hypothetical protein JVT61DRAFT_946 [Boletus reticuloceps]
MSIEKLTRILDGYPEDLSGEDESEESETDEPKDPSGMDGPEDSSGEDKYKDESEEEPKDPSGKDGPKDLSEEDGSKDLSGEDGPEDSSGEDEDEDEDEEDEEFRFLKEEHYYRLMMISHESEIRAYERLKDLQGSAIPRLILTGQFLPPDERAIQPPALLFEYIPSISLFDITAQALTPVIREQLLSIIESLPSHGVVHNDITLTNIHFTPPERPVRGFILDFGCSLVREEVDDEEEWVLLGTGDLRWAKRMLEDESIRQSRVPRSRFQLPT